MIVDIETKVLLRFHNLATLYVYGGAETVLKYCHVTDSNQDWLYAHAHTHVQSPYFVTNVSNSGL